MRQKPVVQCEIENVKDFSIVGDELILTQCRNHKGKFVPGESVERIIKLALPFAQKCRDGDFTFYKAFNSVIPDPFTSIDDYKPKNQLERLSEFASYPNFFST